MDGGKAVFGTGEGLIFMITLIYIYLYLGERETSVGIRLVEVDSSARKYLVHCSGRLEYR
jgi:hypothetical protein